MPCARRYRDDTMSNGDCAVSTGDRGGRRSFLARLATLVIGGIVAVFPFLAGVGVVVDPLRRRRVGAAGDGLPDGVRLVRIGPLAILPADGVPHRFAVTADAIDAWTHSPGRRVGSVFLTRTDDAGGAHVTALSATCPHLACGVEYLAEASQFECPCHDAFFAKDGTLVTGPSPRGLDPLPVEILDRDGQQEIWIAFQQFRAGVAERTPVG
jgi:menaquinol-cytochrome c reductase iron-sulfur subunit